MNLTLVVLTLLWVALTVPLAFSQSTLFQRDVLTMHAPYKALTAAHSVLDPPYFAPELSLGHNVRGNPNALPLYPGNLLYRLLPFWSAFNLHYMLHWALAFFGMWRLAAQLGSSRSACCLGAITYVGSGWMLSNLTFYNLLTLAAWWPFVMLGVARADRRGIALAGAASALAILGGEPVTLVIVAVTLVVVGFEQHGLVRGLKRSTLALGLGALVALPQIVATWRVLPFTWRGAVGAGSELYFLHPLRLLELLIALPFGLPSELGVDRFLEGRIAAGTPFNYSLSLGVVALVLAALAWRHHRGWTGLCLAGLALALVGGVLEPALQAISGGLFRYPEKFVALSAISLPILAARGVDRLRATPSEGSRLWIVVAVGLGITGLAILALGRQWTAWLAVDDPESLVEAIGARPAWRALAHAGVGCVALACAWLGLRRGLTWHLLPLQCLALLPLAVLYQTDALEHYVDAPWAHSPATTRVLSSTYDPVLGTPPPTYFSEEQSRRLLTRIAHQDLDYPTGVRQGLEYPVMPDLEGLSLPPVTTVHRRLPRLPWERKLAWLRTFGIDTITLPTDQPAPGLRLLGQATRAGVVTGLFRLGGSAPSIWWPGHVQAVTSAPDAIEWGGNSSGPDRRCRRSTRSRPRPGRVERAADGHRNARSTLVSHGEYRRPRRHSSSFPPSVEGADDDR